MTDRTAEQPAEPMDEFRSAVLAHSAGLSPDERHKAVTGAMLSLMWQSMTVELALGYYENAVESCDLMEEILDAPDSRPAHSESWERTLPFTRRQLDWVREAAAGTATMRTGIFHDTAWPEAPAIPWRGEEARPKFLLSKEDEAELGWIGSCVLEDLRYGQDLKRGTVDPAELYGAWNLTLMEMLAEGTGLKTEPDGTERPVLTALGERAAEWLRGLATARQDERFDDPACQGKLAKEKFSIEFNAFQTACRHPAR